VLAWLWLDVALACDDPGRRAALRYFHAYELPRIDAWLAVVSTREPVCRDMHDDWF
jgi:butyryl-CoA dehydrogenase